MVRISRFTPDVVDRLHHHHCNRHIGFAIENCTELTQNSDKKSLSLWRSGLVGEASHADGSGTGRRNKAVLERDREAMEGTNCCAGAGKMLIKKLRAL